MAVVIENAQADVCFDDCSEPYRSDGRPRGPTMVPSAGRQHVLLSLLIAADGATGSPHLRQSRRTKR